MISSSSRLACIVQPRGTTLTTPFSLCSSLCSFLNTLISKDNAKSLVGPWTSGTRACWFLCTFSLDHWRIKEKRTISEESHTSVSYLTELCACVTLKYIKQKKKKPNTCIWVFNYAWPPEETQRKSTISRPYLHREVTIHRFLSTTYLPHADVLCAMCATDLVSPYSWSTHSQVHTVLWWWVIRWSQPLLDAGQND